MLLIFTYQLPKFIPVAKLLNVLTYMSFEKIKLFTLDTSNGNCYFDELRSKPEVIDPAQDEDLLEVSDNMNDVTQNVVKSNVTVSSSVRELLECPVCLNAMYPPIHQV